MRIKAMIPLVLVGGLMSASSAYAQQATATGVGVGTSNANSSSNALAISGQGGQGGRGGNARSNSSVNISSNTPAVTSAATNAHINERNVPAVFSPGLSAAGLETCLGSVSGGGSAMGWGASFGTTIPDPGCAARLDARTLWSMGLKKAAVARLCQMVDIYNSMPEVCVRYQPPRAAAYASAAPVVQGGPIELVEGSTGKVRLCNSYDAERQRCRVWAHTVNLKKPVL